MQIVNCTKHILSWSAYSLICSLMGSIIISSQNNFVFSSIITPSCTNTCDCSIDLDFAAQGFTVEDLQFQWTCLTNCNCEIVNDQEDLHNVAAGTYHLWVLSISVCEGQYDFEVLGLSSAGEYGWLLQFFPC